ncbi:MAG: hypothetical protein ACRDSZ_11510 [Pseudonocardiaceae bacterium]
MEFGEHDAKLLDRAEPAGQAAVADEADRFGLPFPAYRVDRGLQGSRVAVVVLGVTMTNASAAPIREVKFALGIGVSARSNDVSAQVVALFGLADEPVDDDGPNRPSRTLATITASADMAAAGFMPRGYILNYY